MKKPPEPRLRLNQYPDDNGATVHEEMRFWRFIAAPYAVPIGWMYKSAATVIRSEEKGSRWSFELNLQHLLWLKSILLKVKHDPESLAEYLNEIDAAIDYMKVD